MSNLENIEESSLLKETVVKEAREFSKASEPRVIGNDRIKILKHSLETLYLPTGDIKSCINFAIRNVSDTTIASIMFEAVFYDMEGNILDTVKHGEIELKPNTSRAVNIVCTNQAYHKIKSYEVKIARMTTSDEEKVQLRMHEISTTEAGEEEVRGLVRNISNVKTDAALVATFSNSKDENIGAKVIIMRDIEPNSTKQFHFLFKPPEGVMVKTYRFNVVCDIEEQELNV